MRKVNERKANYDPFDDGEREQWRESEQTTYDSPLSGILNPEALVDDEQTLYGEEEIRPGYFIQVLSEFHKSPEYSIWAKGLYCLLLGYVGKGDKAFPSMTTLGEELGCHRNKVGQVIDELVEKGLLVKKRRGLGQTNIYLVRKFNDRFIKRKKGNVS